jgi:hypothetical protein
MDGGGSTTVLDLILAFILIPRALAHLRLSHSAGYARNPRDAE